MTVEAKQTVDSWQGPAGTIEYFSGNQTKAMTYSAGKSGTKNYTVSISIDESGNATPVVNAGS